eukprot:450448-Amorphochlora_amoeboformis.AAC.1
MEPESYLTKMGLRVWLADRDGCGTGRNIITITVMRRVGGTVEREQGVRGEEYDWAGRLVLCSFQG